MAVVSPIEHLRESFGPQSRKRGEVLARDGGVVGFEVNDGGVSARVGNARSYFAALVWEGVDRPGFCSCPGFERFGPCMHMWAVALEAEARGVWVESEDEVVTSPEAEWRLRVGDLQKRAEQSMPDPWAEVDAGRARIRYVLDVSRSRNARAPVVRVVKERQLKNGGWGAPKEFRVEQSFEAEVPEPEDRRILALLGMHRKEEDLGYSVAGLEAEGPRTLAPVIAAEVLPMMCATGRFSWEGASDSTGPLSWEGGDPWTLQLTLEREADEESGTEYLVLGGWLARGDDRLGLAEPQLLLETGLVIARDSIARFDPLDAMAWADELRSRGPMVVPAADEPELRRELAQVPSQAWHGEPELAVREPQPPIPHLTLEAPKDASRTGQRVVCRVSFDYGVGQRVKPEAAELLVEALDGGPPARRDLDAEKLALGMFLRSGVRQTTEDRAFSKHGSVTVRAAPALVRSMIQMGWSVEAEGKMVRRAGGVRGKVRSGQDWFDLQGGIEFGDQVASFPELLAAARSGRQEVTLGDGSVGLLPEDWLASWGLLELASGGEEEDALRFPAHQAWLLDALLHERAEIEADDAFVRFCERLANFEGIEPIDQPPGFHGELRAYQRDGLGWFGFLRELGVGGCLADDMGLGKTVQVLALLEARREEARARGEASQPTLVVAPKSLVFNWIDEAGRFAPELVVLDHTGPDRGARWRDRDNVDMVVTTYGTLRRDVKALGEIQFDYVVLDEATAIKNATSQSAKAARLLNARHRLALTGTPIENHLGELWSLFEFLNPGMLGRSAAFQRFHSAGGDGQSFAGLARALKPYFLRRTKKEVLDDLPPKSEQIVLCELSEAERRRYDELRNHYRGALLGTAPADFGRMKIQVLEALLRLRQAACHVGLIDDDLRGADSAKLEALLPRLEELAEEGHKVLVFSQFTKLLSIVRERLDARGLVYEYLDGQTRDRKARVERFQSDPDCPLFLISLKAGGHGLNLTASDYVFLLDPWWNPAVEAQAVDRAHRIGQTRPVFAYRLIAKDTVEQKVLELQESKKALAETLLGQGSGVLKDMTRDDLEALLS